MGTQFPLGLFASSSKSIDEVIKNPLMRWSKSTDEVIENRHLGDMKSTLPENSGRVSCLRHTKRFFRHSAVPERQRRPSDGILTTLITLGFPESERSSRQ
jgi:hypothetical protein